MNDSTITFAQLGLTEPLLRALAEKNYTQPSPIQAEAIPHLLEGRDLMGSAQTGTGKTAAFALPMLQRLAAQTTPRTSRCPRALILTPTRELAVQIGESFSAYGRFLNLRHVVIYGGVGQSPQAKALTQGVDIAIATPGRLLDLACQGYVRFDRVEIFVLDEADRMLDMGFAPDLNRIVAKLPEVRQSLLFSATLPQSILSLAARVVRKPIRVEMTPESPAVERIDQRVCHVGQGQKYPLLRKMLEEGRQGLVLAFTRTKHGANKLAKNLSRDGHSADAIHGNKSQAARQRALDNFRSGDIRILVATDVAARGIDVKDIMLVVNYDLPNEPEAYVHRIGRTARAGAEGRAVSFCDPGERAYLRSIQRLIRKDIPVHPEHARASSHSAPEENRAPAHSNRPTTYAAPARAGNGYRPQTDSRPSYDSRPRQYSPAQHAPTHRAHTDDAPAHAGYGHRPAQSTHRSGFSAPGRGQYQQRRGGFRPSWQSGPKRYGPQATTGA